MATWKSRQASSTAPVVPSTMANATSVPPSVYSTCQRSPRISARDRAPGDSASSARMTSDPPAARIASRAEIAKPGGGVVWELGCSSGGGS